MESDGRVPHLIIFADGDIVNSEERHWRSSISRYVQIGFPQEKASEISYWAYLKQFLKFFVELSQSIRCNSSQFRIYYSSSMLNSLDLSIFSAALAHIVALFQLSQDNHPAASHISKARVSLLVPQRMTSWHQILSAHRFDTAQRAGYAKSRSSISAKVNLRSDAPPQRPITSAYPSRVGANPSGFTSRKLNKLSKYCPKNKAWFFDWK